MSFRPSGNYRINKPQYPDPYYHHTSVTSCCFHSVDRQTIFLLISCAKSVLEPLKHEPEMSQVIHFSGKNPFPMHCGGMTFMLYYTKTINIKELNHKERWSEPPQIDEGRNIDAAHTHGISHHWISLTHTEYCCSGLVCASCLASQYRPKKALTHLSHSRMWIATSSSRCAILPSLISRDIESLVITPISVYW